MVVDSKSAVNEYQETIDWTVAGARPTLSSQIQKRLRLARRRHRQDGDDMTTFRRSLAGLAATFACSLACAQAYPAKPIRVLVPFPPGGGTDIVAREVTQRVATNTRWTFVIDNKPGAGGNLGVDAAAKSPPDGYTIVLGQTSNLAINPTLYSKLPYDPVKDLTPIGLVASAPLVLVVPTQSPYKSLADLVAAAKAKPGEVNFASPGNGTVAH